MNLDDAGADLCATHLPDLARFRFGLRALDSISLPEFPGSAWRGLLGHGLRRTVCVTRQPTCKGCLLLHSCVYSQLFETPPPPGLDASGFTAMPHPYVLNIDPRASRHYEPGAAMGFGITLMGPAIGQVPYLIHALGMAGQRGLGRDQGRFAVDCADRETMPGGDIWERVYDAESGEYLQRDTVPLHAPDAPDRVRLRLVTPLRIKRDSRFVVPRDFQLADLLRHLYTRLQRLSRLYAGSTATFAWGPDHSAAPGLHLSEPRLHWHDWTRYSSRQHSLMQMGGLIGDMVLAGPGLGAVWPALWAGQWTHVGKGTSFGLGSYRLEPVEDPL